MFTCDLFKVTLVYYVRPGAEAVYRMGLHESSVCSTKHLRCPQFRVRRRHFNDNSRIGGRLAMLILVQTQTTVKAIFRTGAKNIKRTLMAVSLLCGAITTYFLLWRRQLCAHPGFLTAPGSLRSHRNYSGVRRLCKSCKCREANSV